MSYEEKRNLERKAKKGWHCYYMLLEKYAELGDYIESGKKYANALKDNKDDDMKFLKSQFLEMYEKLKEYSECPVCFETIKKDTAKLGNCGHMVCTTCYEKLDKCPNCRKKYYKFINNVN